MLIVATVLASEKLHYYISQGFPVIFSCNEILNNNRPPASFFQMFDMGI